MATIIQIKRSANVAAPTTTDLVEGELAYSQDKSNSGVGAKLYIESLDSGDNPVVHAIGGKYYTDRIDAATASNTPSTLVFRNAQGSFSANVITAETFVGNITVASAPRLTTARDIGLAGDLTGNVSFDGSQNVTLTATIAANSVALGTDTTGDYLANVVPGAGLTGTNFGTEGATPTLSLAASGVTPTTYGGTTNIPVLVVDTYGRITSASNAAVSTSFTLAANAGTPDTLSGGDTLRFTGGTGINTTVSDNTITIVNTGVTSLSGTTNEIEVSASNATVQIGLPNDVVIGNNLTVTGDLIVQGTAVTMNTATLVVEDPLVKFGNANPSDSLDIGFFGEYVSSGTKFAGLFRDASDSGKFKLFTDLTTNPTSNVVDTASYTVATLVTNITGGTVSGLTANIAVGDGGTGRGTLTTNAVLYGQGTSAVGLATGSAGQVLQLNGSGVPVFGGIDGGTY